MIRPTWPYCALSESQMRPVEKVEPGAFLPVGNKGYKIAAVYHPYQKAKVPLVANLGHYCSYCESVIPNLRDVQVEHVQPKSLPQYAHLAESWDNFVLSCSTCNGKDNKGDKDVILSECLLPHRDNTYLGLTYLPGGVIEVNPKRPEEEQKRAARLLALVGLDKTPGQAAPTDIRWKQRLEIWHLAERYLGLYQRGAIAEEVVIDLAVARGGWSIWFTVFEGCDRVREQLIAAFPGTASRSFDPQQHYAPVERP